VSNAKRNEGMGFSTATLKQFSRYCWSILPIRREVVGQEMVQDCIILVVQFWPAEELSQMDAASLEEANTLYALEKDVLRSLAFIYGEDRYEGYMRLGLRQVLKAIIEITRHWWRRRKPNRAKINVWRRKWVSDDAE
jgi:hypothetical protein